MSAPVDRCVRMVSHSVSSVNEDMVGFSQNEGWILDGATSISGRRRSIAGREETEASWFVRAFSDGLRRRPSDVSLETWSIAVLRDMQPAARAEWGDWEGTDIPSASYAHIHLQEGSASLMNLGDCRIFYQSDDGPISAFGSCDVQRLEALLLKTYREIRRDNSTISYKDAWTRLVPVIRANRQLMNSHAGYWILSPDGKGIPQLQRTEVRYMTSLRAMLVTDGLYRLVDTYFQMTAETFFERAFEPEGLVTLVRELRLLEARDMTATSYPRVKLQDDASAVVIYINMDTSPFQEVKS